MACWSNCSACRLVLPFRRPSIRQSFFREAEASEDVRIRKINAPRKEGSEKKQDKFFVLQTLLSTAFMTRVPNEAELLRCWQNHDFFPAQWCWREKEAWVREKDPSSKIKSAKTYRKVENQRLSGLVSGAGSAWVGCARERAAALYATGENKD